MKPNPTRPELDRASAEMVMVWTTPKNHKDVWHIKKPHPHGLDEPYSVWVINKRDWNPADPNSSQVFRYLIPKLVEMGCEIEPDFSKEGFFIAILDDQRNWVNSEREMVTDPDKINEVMVIAILEAFEKIREGA